jgi:hypothetical protein
MQEMSLIKKRTYAFALKIIDLHKILTVKSEYVMLKQLITQNLKLKTHNEAELVSLHYFVSSTGHLAPFRTFRVTLPIRNRAMPDLPREAMTIRSMPLSSASFRIAS